MHTETRAARHETERSAEPQADIGSSTRLLAAFAELDDFWGQRVVGNVNGQLVKIAKGRGATYWHRHDDQDEAFLVVRGALTVETEESSETLHPFHFRVVPRGMRHRVVAHDEAWFVVIGTGITSTPEGGQPARIPESEIVS